MDKQSNDHNKQTNVDLNKVKTNQDYNKQKPNPNNPNQLKNHEIG